MYSISSLLKLKRKHCQHSEMDVTIIILASARRYIRVNLSTYLECKTCHSIVLVIGF